VPETLVDVLEVVEIHQQQRDLVGPAGPAGPAGGVRFPHVVAGQPVAGQGLGQRPPVGQAGQVVGPRADVGAAGPPGPVQPGQRQHQAAERQQRTEPGERPGQRPVAVVQDRHRDDERGGAGQHAGQADPPGRRGEPAIRGDAAQPGSGGPAGQAEAGDRQGDQQGRRTQGVPAGVAVGQGQRRQPAQGERGLVGDRQRDHPGADPAEVGAGAGAAEGRGGHRADRQQRAEQDDERGGGLDALGRRVPGQLEGGAGQPGRAECHDRPVPAAARPPPGQAGPEHQHDRAAGQADRCQQADGDERVQVSGGGRAAPCQGQRGEQGGEPEESVPGAELVAPAGPPGGEAEEPSRDQQGEPTGGLHRPAGVDPKSRQCQENCQAQQLRDVSGEEPGRHGSVHVPAGR
jgi:hypothetical protein